MMQSKLECQYRGYWPCAAENVHQANGMMQFRRLLMYVGMGYCCAEMNDRMEMTLLHHTMFHALPTQSEHTFIVLKCHCRVRYMHIE